MPRGILYSAIVAVLVCSSAASGSIILSCDGQGGGQDGSQDHWYNLGPNQQIRTWDQIKVSPQRESNEFVQWAADPGGEMTLCFVGEVVRGQANFWAEYCDGANTVCTPIQSIKCGQFCLETCLPCIPAQTVLCLANTDDHGPLIIHSSALLITAVPAPEPATIGLLTLALGCIFLRRVYGA